jgi:hypothetical protein
MMTLRNEQGFNFKLFVSVSLTIVDEALLPVLLC